MSSQFPPLADERRFPILGSLGDLPCTLLMACDNLAFFAPSDQSTARHVACQPSVGWHEYGDTRWPSPSSWIEFTLPERMEGCACGAMVLRTEIEAEGQSIYDWVAYNHPLRQVMPQMRAENAVETVRRLLEGQRLSAEHIAGPTDDTPRYVQAYCLFVKKQNRPVEFIASYTDLLNSEGLPLPRFRTADLKPDNVRICRLILHALFLLNIGRMSGMHFSAYEQCHDFKPIHLDGSRAPPKWTAFHPCRTIRNRPSLRQLPVPTLHDGIMSLEDHEQVADLRRRELNCHMLGFAREIRSRESGLTSKDTNSTFGAYLNRVNGGAIYTLPAELVEEFDHTECGEVKIADLALPFFNLFIRFNPPKDILLGEGAIVDGCYIAKQGDEYLFTLTSRLQEVDYERSLSVTCLDPYFSLHLPAGNPEVTINEAVSLGITNFFKQNAPPAENFSKVVTRPDGTHAYFEDVRAKSRQNRIALFKSQEAQFKACLNIIVNAACFISFRPTDIKDAWEGQPPDEMLKAIDSAADSRGARDRKAGALQRIANGDYTRVKICGLDLFSAGKKTEPTENGKSPRTHWRRGHWRRQKHGTGLAAIVIRWIRPTIVNPDHGPLVETRYYEV